MKQEEMSDICTILVEGQDGRAEVMDQVRKQHKPVVIVVPEYASQVFQSPEDFQDLRRVKRECGIPITLVLPGHERMRNWARRQGFTVYASSETCARMLARRDRFNALRGISSPHFASESRSGSQNLERFTFPLLSEQDDDEEDDALWSWETEEPPDEEDMPGASSSRSAAPEGIEQFGTAWRITGNGWEMAWPAGERTTDGMVSLARQEQIANGKTPTREVSTLPLDLTQFVPSIQTGAVDRGEETPAANSYQETPDLYQKGFIGKAPAPKTPTRGVSTSRGADQRSPLVGVFGAGSGFPGANAPTTEPLYEHWTDQREKVVPREAIRSHTLVLVLTVLLILGLLGGIGFGYVLSLLHAGLGAMPWMAHLSFL